MLSPSYWNALTCLCAGCQTRSNISGLSVITWQLSFVRGTVCLVSGPQTSKQCLFDGLIWKSSTKLRLGACPLRNRAAHCSTITVHFIIVVSQSPGGRNVLEIHLVCNVPHIQLNIQEYSTIRTRVNMWNSTYTIDRKHISPIRRLDYLQPQQEGIALFFKRLGRQISNKSVSLYGAIKRCYLWIQGPDTRWIGNKSTTTAR